MILKIMSGARMPDEAANAPCIVIAGVSRVLLDHRITDRQAFIQFWLDGTYPMGAEEGERHKLEGNAYLMTDQGKTVQAFSPNFPQELIDPPAPQA